MIDLIDVSVLRAACPERTVAQLAPWVDPIKKACARFDIDTIRRVSAFLASIAHESGFVPGREEVLNYRAARLAEVWPGRFRDANGQPNLRARELANNPEKLANVVYANRMGNGGPETGDGWRFRGVGPVQLTGRSNHEGFALAMGLTVVGSATYIRTLEGGIMSAAWFWDHNDINRLADTPGIEDETKRLNGGLVGVADRRERFNRTVARLLEREQ
ncbi:MAG: glycoside hydrolase family 19 protein [Beijerinckiaceae bacterium]